MQVTDGNKISFLPEVIAFLTVFCKIQVHTTKRIGWWYV